MPTVCTTIKVSKDGQYILATGKHLFGYDLTYVHFIAGNLVVRKAFFFFFFCTLMCFYYELKILVYVLLKRAQVIINFKHVEILKKLSSEYPFICYLDSVINNLLCLLSHISVDLSFCPFNIPSCFSMHFRASCRYQLFCKKFFFQNLIFFK
jgi:hypothetical protein